MRSTLFLCAILLLIVSSSWAQTSVTWGNNSTRTDYRSDAGLQGDQGAMSGFYETPNPVNFPAGASGWWHLLDVRHSNSANNFAMQFSGSFFDQNLYFRKTINIYNAAWNRVVLEDPNGMAGIGRVLTRSIAYADGDKFTYNNGASNYSINNYGLEWNTDSWFPTAPTAWLSGFGGIKMFTGGQCRFVMTPGGNVGIGTSNPGYYKLAVDGDMVARKVRVTQGSNSVWPDYVFHKKYNLRKLNAVAAYIQRNRHLPDVPPAIQIAKDGLDLGENQAVLLRKVEELTLYVIQLNQAVQKLQQENKQQQRTIARLTYKK